MRATESNDMHDRHMLMRIDKLCTNIATTAGVGLPRGDMRKMREEKLDIVPPISRGTGNFRRGAKLSAALSHRCCNCLGGGQICRVCRYGLRTFSTCSVNSC